MKHYSLLFILAILVFISCKHKENKGPSFSDTPKSGSINISVDESFMPVIQDQIKVYQQDYPGTKINAVYKPEAQCLKNFFKDTATRMAIVTRNLTHSESTYMKDSLGYFPSSGMIATDAVVVIVNKESNDTTYTMAQLQSLLLGKGDKSKTIVFDGLSATSTVRFIQDSVLEGQMFDTSVVRAAASTDQAIDYVINNRNAIGLVGISWIGNPEMPEQVAKLEKLKMAYVQCDVCEGKPFVKPMRSSIGTRRYPLVRGLYFILKEDFTGLGTGFSSFLKYERGQLVFRRAYLGTVMELNVRNVKVNTKMPEN